MQVSRRGADDLSLGEDSVSCGVHRRVRISPPPWTCWVTWATNTTSQTPFPHRAMGLTVADWCRRSPAMKFVPSVVGFGHSWTMMSTGYLPREFRCPGCPNPPWRGGVGCSQLPFRKEPGPKGQDLKSHEPSGTDSAHCAAALRMGIISDTLVQMVQSLLFGQWHPVFI